MRGSRTLLSRLTGHGDDLHDLESSRVPAHLRQLVRVAPTAILVAVVAALVAALVNAAAAPAYRATSTAQIDAQIPVIAGDAYLYQNTAPYLTLADSGTVLDEVSRQMGSAWPASRVAEQTSVEVARSPLLLTVQATAPTVEESIHLTRALIEALDDAAGDQRRNELDRAVASRLEQREQLERRLDRLPPTAAIERAGIVESINSLQDQINRVLGAGENGLSALAVPGPNGVDKVSPRSPLTAVFIGLVVFIVVAEALVLSARFGRRLSAEAIRGIGASNDLPIDTAPEATMPAVTEALIARSRRDHSSTTLIVASPQSLAAAESWAAHDDPDHPADDEPDSDSIDSPRPAPAVTVVPLTKRWPTHLAETTGHVVFVVALGEPVKSEFAAAASESAELGVSGRIVVRPADPRAPVVADPEAVR